MKALLALPALLFLAGCVTTGEGSVAGGECKVFEAPHYAVKGARPYDQDWIDSTIEGGVGACHWNRPAPRPAAMDAVAPAPKKHVVKPKPKPKKRPLWIRMLRSLKRPAAAPVAPVAEPEPAAPPAPPPPPRSAIDELLQP